MTGPEETGPEETGPEEIDGLDEALADPALAAAVHELELHAAADGWDQKSRHYALALTSDPVVKEPGLAAALGPDAASAEGRSEERRVGKGWSRRCSSGRSQEQ